MEISEKQEGKSSVLTPVGRLDNETSAEFQVKLLYTVAESSAVLIDLSRVEYISSAGLRALMMASVARTFSLRCASRSGLGR